MHVSLPGRRGLRCCRRGGVVVISQRVPNLTYSRKVLCRVVVVQRPLRALGVFVSTPSKIPREIRPIGSDCVSPDLTKVPTSIVGASCDAHSEPFQTRILPPPREGFPTRIGNDVGAFKVLLKNADAGYQYQSPRDGE